MMSEELILVKEVCVHYKVEETFLYALHASELIHLHTQAQQMYMRMDEITNFERLWRLHYDLNINIEGLEAVVRLLDKVERLQHDNRLLRNRLKRYEI